MIFKEPSIIKLTVKKLQGGQCIVEVPPSASVSQVKRQIAKHFKIPVGEQKLLFLGRTLLDGQTLSSYPTIKDGSRLNLIVKKPESLQSLLFESFKRSGRSDFEARNASKKFIKTMEKTINRMSWDDIERLSLNCLQESARLKHVVPK